MVSGPRFRRVRYIPVLLALLAGFSISIRQTAVAQQTWSLPAPWNVQDIGNPPIAGSASFDQNTFTITATGSDIGGQSDQFTFVYQQVTGDVEVSARVDSVSAADAWSKSGVMIRSSLSADAAHGYALVSAERGVAFQRRLSDGGSSRNTYGPSAAAPYWVRLVRKGTTVTAYSSADGTSWVTISSGTIALGSTAYVGIATTSHNTAAATTAAVSQVSIVPQSLPAPQQSTDIGAPAIKGSFSYSQGVYSVHAGGADIWDTSDQFHFVYQPMTGDGEVVAHVQSLTNTDSWAKTGVMIRETLAADSRHAFALVTAGSGYAFQRRIDPAGITQHTGGPAGAAPGWVRLVRTASRIDAYQSSNGSTWTLMGSDAIPMVNTVYVGIATTSHNTTTATDAVLDNFKVTPSGSASNQPPNVGITSPADGSTFTAGTDIMVNAAANDADGTVSRVDFFAGTTQIGSSTTAPYSAKLSGAAAGTYSLTAVAVDNDGSSTTSATVSIRVNPAANQPPTINLTAPANGATYTAPASMSLSASAADSDGTIAKVEFYNGTTLLNTDTAAPYAFTWSSVSAGTYTIKAVAYDNAGASASSATATVSVTAANATPSNGLVGAYSLDEGTGSVAGDSAGVVPSGTITNATWTAGRLGQALSFAGNGEVNLGDVDFSGQLTVEGWFQTKSLYAGTCGSFVMKVHDYGFELCDGQLAGAVGANDAWTARALVTLTSADLNTWKHAAMTYDGTSVRLYINGTLVSTVSGAHTSTNYPLLFGHWSTGSEYWNGLIDEVRLYSRALTQAEIQTDMNTPVGAGTGNRPPTATLTAPANGATYTAPASMSLTVTASDSDGTIARVEFYNGTTLLNTDTTAPYAFTWSSVAAGTYAIKAVAYDNSGASGSSATATITVSGPNQRPTVTLTAPANGSTFTAPASITLSASAADSDGTIAKVEFYSGTTLLNTDTTAPYSFTWSSVAAGSYALKAIAYDNNGASASSAISTITVSTTTTTPPTGVVFTASADHATLVTRYELRIYASGADPNTATPIATSDLGKPTPDANNNITVDRSAFFSALAVGNYGAAVAAIGSGGSSISAGVTFTR
jgi:regulation of enolase protein 1 (concanavalin A-like superfamily)